MNVEDLVRDTFREQAAGGVRTPPDFADRVLAVRRRRRTRTLAGAAVATVAAVAAAVAVPLLDTGGDDVRPAGETNRSDIIAHPDQSPPRDLIAAGDTVLAAFSAVQKVEQPNKDEIITRTYRLLDQRTGRYEKDSRWSLVDVAPGGRTAAVLERELPARRVGLLNLMTGEVDRWIPVPQGAAGIDFSPDGRKLLATTYDKNPDRLYWSRRRELIGPHGKVVEPQGMPSRTGFSVIDVASGKADWHKASSWKDSAGRSLNPRSDFLFNLDGKLLYEHTYDQPYRVYHDLVGRTVPTPPDEKKLVDVDTGASPDGKLVAFPSGVRVLATGKRVPGVPDVALLAWAGNKRLVAWQINEHMSGNPRRLVLLTLGTDKLVPLSGYGTQEYDARHWDPLFGRR
ncbi:WD40 repeat domain-containing protein [Streptomyces sp. NPDC048415]|uniref:WD40 repeat domain-containing protein n=1 Tax=Streptomyces sp. NPDC048415 TaxID=3154822 RepID=UPI003421FB63